MTELNYYHRLLRCTRTKPSITDVTIEIVNQLTSGHTVKKRQTSPTHIVTKIRPVSVESNIATELLPNDGRTIRPQFSRM